MNNPMRSVKRMLISLIKSCSSCNQIHLERLLKGGGQEYCTVMVINSQFARTKIILW